MSNPDHSQGTHSQENDQNHTDQPQEVGSILNDQEEAIDEWDEENDEEEYSDEDYYDPEIDLEYFHDQKLRIEESWLEWERQSSVNNRQNSGSHGYNIFQKPGSVKRRERRKRTALAQLNAQANRPASASSTGSGSGGDLSGSNAATEKSKRSGSYRPALASSIVHSYSNLTWEAIQAAREKRLAAKTASNGSGAERSDPKSWRGEYIKRTRLLRRWEKGRGSNVLINPGIGQISKLWAETDNNSSDGTLLAASLTEGIVAKCDPVKGKVQRDAVFQMFRFAHLEVTVMAMDRRRVLWGLSTGQVSLTTLSYGAAGQTFQTFAGFHFGPVSCVKLIPNYLGFVLTGGVDGVVKLWDVARARCVYEFLPSLNPSEPLRSRIDHICCEPGSYVVAGTSRGDVYVWDIDINSIISPTSVPASSDNAGATAATQPAAVNTDPQTLSEVIPTHATPKSVNISQDLKGVGYLEVDFGLYSSGLILTHSVGSTVMHLYNLETLLHVATLKSPAHFTPISAVHWDIPKHEKPMISLSNGSHLNSGATHHGRHDLPSLLVTGDNSGNICIWYLSDALKRNASKGKDLHESQMLHEAIDLQPTCVMKGHDAAVTSLYMDKLIIVSGSKNGWAKTWNPVNGRMISILNNGNARVREANNTVNSAVNSLTVNSQNSRGALSLGGIIRCWDFSLDAAKDKHRKQIPKRPVNYSGGPKNRIQIDIRRSVEETVSLHRLEAQTKERREQLHRRYNNLEGLNMVDMTDEEVVEYVMMLSKEHGDQESAQTALEMQQILEMEEELAREKQIRSDLNNGGEGSSTAPSRLASLQYGEQVTEQELEEEEELVRRAIALSMLDAETPAGSDFDTHFHESSDHEDLHSAHTHQPLDWEASHIVDVDVIGGELEQQEDRQIVQSILQEIEDTDDESLKEKIKSETWPTLGKASAVEMATGTSSAEPSQSSPPLASPQSIKGDSSGGSKPEETPTKKMTWSMVARSNSETSISSSSGGQKLGQNAQQQSNRQPALIKQYPRSASQEEIEDEDTQLARILSLSMVEK
ncbi:hypothetical protein BGZ80_011550 [Entomortierella chlamydospora]|uniref:Uncharacterized protein n=1 Tax=Entomortierella chlamydospora TaxID=101097 RepID=A0A9P6SZI9_9FUNG|nr:hypothetical protein BGZ79_006372 [Entomortierella chlamydospora]KAG0012739.1 hypothetical protein BGZ80_011550 [Entomortierella chlamydospora]